MNLDLAIQAKQKLEEQLMEAISVNRYASAIATATMMADTSFKHSAGTESRSAIATIKR